jgi:hypothetical protein
MWQVILNQRVATASDMYSYGVLMWRVFSGQPVMVEHKEADEELPLDGELPERCQAGEARLRLVVSPAFPTFAAPRVPPTTFTRLMLRCAGTHVGEQTSGSFLHMRCGVHHGRQRWKGHKDMA